MKNLEIGPRDDPVPGFDYLDMLPREDVKYVARWGYEPLPIPDAEYDFLFASHVLEHIPWWATVEALREALRVLKPGGRLEVWVPNFEFVAKCYLQNRCGDAWRRMNPESNPMLWVAGRTLAYGPGEENWHHALFDKAHLMRCLREAGFTYVSQVKKRKIGVSHGPELDLGVEGVRPE